MSVSSIFSGRAAAAAFALATTALSGLLMTPAQAAQGPFETFDSTVRIYNCSASVIQLPETSDDDNALILTNGHCIEPVFGRYLERGEVIVDHSLSDLNKPYFKRMTFNGGAHNERLLGGQLTKVVYSTMDNTDIAILESDKTYGELKENGVKVRSLSTVRPVEGTQIGIPSTYWGTEYSCRIHGFASELHEGNWVWRDAMRYSASGCNIQGGSSGSPIINAATGEIIGINNTVVEGGVVCRLGNPCEVDEHGVTQIWAGRGYGTQTYYIPSCFDGSQLNLNKSSCQLPR